ncbi:MAG: PCMD domain-containing protein [Bacteroidaceae bacterium]|nr:PCMD domain-containing protein [Bacteroidaceae bacterium]
MKKIYYILSVLFVAALASACSNELEGVENDQVGYLRLGVETNTVAKTRVTNVPNNYVPKQLYVEVTDAQGNIVASTTDFDNDTSLKGATLKLNPGTYTVTAHSNNWDGSGSGVDAPFYYGTTTVQVQTKVLTTANVICTLANVKVTVNFSDDFVSSFQSATSTIESVLDGVGSITYTMGQNKGPAYFPVGNLRAILSVFNKSGEGHSMLNNITDVKARDHYILNYTVAASGNQGDVTVKVDPTTNTYTYTFEVPRKSGTALAAYSANAWSTFAYISGAVTSKKSDFDQTKVTLQYKVTGATDWTTVDNSALAISGDDITYTLKGILPSTDYTYRFAYTTADDEVYSNEATFTTEGQPALYNGGFEEWHQDGSVWYPTAAGTTYWDSSNPGSASMGDSYNVTTGTTETVHSGSKAAKLQSMYVIIKFAAASIYTGSFDHLVGTKGAVLNWGVPFTGRPTSLHGFMQYAPGNINRGTAPAGAPAKGQPDQCQIYCVLTNSAIQIDNTDMDNFPNWQTDSRVVAYGTLPASQCVDSNGSWKEFDIPLEYNNLTKKPTHLIIVCSSSRYGDYFYGSDTSCLYLDDFELLYTDTPTVKN